jgi:hypothetical protein
VLRVLDVCVGVLSSLECFVASHTRTTLRSLTVRGNWESSHRLPMRAVEPLRALRVLEYLLCTDLVVHSISDAEWQCWRIHGPGPHAALDAQPQLLFIHLEDRDSSRHKQPWTLFAMPPAYVLPAP